MQGKEQQQGHPMLLLVVVVWVSWSSSLVLVLP
jgi:hypothetical protein